MSSGIVRRAWLCSRGIRRRTPISFERGLGHGDQDRQPFRARVRRCLSPAALLPSWRRWCRCRRACWAVAVMMFFCSIVVSGVQLITCER